MSFRSYLDQLKAQSGLVPVAQPISKIYEIAGVLKRLEPTPALFENVRESGFRVVGNLFCTKAAFAGYFGVPVKAIIPTLAKAIEARAPCRVVEEAPCQEVVLTDPDLDSLPLLRHCPGDGGNYLSSGVVIARHPRYGQNADFHRGMQISPRELALRVVRGRHFDTFLRDLKELDIAICVGCPPNVLAAAATSVDIGVDELHIANALESLAVVKAKSVDLYIPAEVEFVLEGTVYLERRHAEGPFVDLTGLPDAVREEPVFAVKTITHRRDAIWQALLPGALEHQLLMGMPREPTIFRQVNQVVRCLDVNVTPGGCAWLHAIVQIDKRSEQDGVKAIHAAFAGHSSCKHVFIVDDDIDIYDPAQVEWALATRFQGDTRLVIKDKERGSSLDPSAEPGTHFTTKLGFDLTMPLRTAGSPGSGWKTFEKARYPEVDLAKFICP
jgi:UbiD family decarboxylase